MILAILALYLLHVIGVLVAYEETYGSAFLHSNRMRILGRALVFKFTSLKVHDEPV